MSSGSPGMIKRAKLAQRERMIAADAAARNRQRLVTNGDAVQSALEQLLIDYAGWSEIDSWAAEAIAQIRRGEYVDLDALTRQITAWREQHVQQS